jgi:hypothetical protein
MNINPETVIRRALDGTFIAVNRHTGDLSQMFVDRDWTPDYTQEHLGRYPQAQKQEGLTTPKGSVSVSP